MPARRPGSLSDRRQRVVRALLPVFCPPDVDDPALASAVGDHVELTVHSLSPLARAALLSALDLIEVAGLRHGRLTSHQPAEDRRGTVAGLRRRSPGLRRVVGSVRDVIVIAYFDQPPVKDRLGYRPDEWTDVMQRARQDRWSGEIAQHEERLRRPSAPPPLDP